MGAAVGAFGKMPSVGDFFRIDAPTGFVRVWDDWIQQGMLGASEVLGTTWDELYMTAPIWRFTLSGGLAGASPVMGVLMPSVDRVGRRFPLTLMAEVEGPAIEVHLSADEHFAALENLALDALEDDMTRDLLAERLSQLEAATTVTTTVARQNGASFVLTEEDGDGDLGASLTAGLAQARYQSPSIWTAFLHEGRRSLICEGLPQGAEQVALFDLTSPIWKEVQPA